MVGSETAQVASDSGQRGPLAVIILDDLHHVGSAASLADAFNALLGLPLHEWCVGLCIFDSFKGLVVF